MCSSDSTPYEKVGNNEPVSIADEVPFEIPESWEWARASSLGQMVRGKGIKRAETISEGMPCVRYGEIYTTYNTSFTNTKSFIPQQLYSQCNLFHTGDLIFTLTGENKPDIAKAVAYLGESPVAAGGDLAYWTYHKMNPLYLAYFMASPYCIEQKRRLATGDIIVHISTDKVGSFLVPVPPKAEQDRIVAKLQEIEPLLQEYDRNEQKVHLELKLFPEQIKKSILQMAVQGKLVPQDPDDEPASVLLERIRTEKERLIKEGKIKRDKNESVIYKRDNSHYTKRGSEVTCIDDEIPFDIPESWQWCELSSICSIITDGEHKTPRRTTSYVGYYLLSARNIRDGFISLDDVDYVDEEEYSLISKRCNPQRGDVLISCSGSVGRISVVCDDNSYVMVRSAAMASPVIVNSEYLMYAMQSDIVQAQIKEKTKQAVQANLFQGAIRELFIPLPPLQEQSRICAALRPLLRLCKFSL